MGAHKDNGVIHTLHKWRERALRAERELADHEGEQLLQQILEQAIPVYSNQHGWRWTIPDKLYFNVMDHREGE